MRIPVCAALVVLLIGSLAHAADINVSTAGEIESAFGSANAGDRIVIAPGEYNFNSAVWTGSNGPITVTTTQIGAAKLNFNSVEGIVVNHADWTIEKIWVNGVCSGENCDAGIGVKPGALRFKLDHARASNWTQHVKGSRDPNNEVEDAQILSSEFWNDGLRPSGSSPIDVVGGKRWRIIGNYIHDYGGDPNGDYGIFLKGATSNGLIERNLVICAQDNPAGGATVGISFGGGGTGYSFCPNQNCDCEDYDSIARNNIVLHCTDTGLHTKRACGSKFYNNTVYDVGNGVQIQINGAGAPVEIRNNVMSAGVSGPGNLYTESNNIFDAPASTFRNAYVDPDNADFRGGSNASALENQGSNLNDVTDDYCGTSRSATDLGAIEFPGSCSTWPWTGDIGPIGPVPDAGVPDTGTGPDAGGGPDAGAPDSGANPPDAGPSPDAGAPLDAGTSPVDAGGNAQPDGGTLADAGQGSDLDGDAIGGGCSNVSGTGSDFVAWLVLGFGLLAWSRRRRSA